MAETLDPVVLTFGGGINARRHALDLDIAECQSGENFHLDVLHYAYAPRAAFDLKGTAPNVGQIRGYAQLRTKAGTLTTLIQAGTQVYSWNGTTGFTSVGSVAATSKLRGGIDQNFTLDDYTIITDLNKADVVKKWDGTTFSTFPHNLGGNFYSKFCRVFGERAWFGNVTTGGTATPHVILGSKISNGANLSATNRPTSSLGYDESFYLITPDLRPINGFEQAFRNFLISTDRGRLFALSGSSAFDFEITDFYQGSSVSGDEAIVNIGNDVLMGLPSRIESLSGTLDYGDVETNDVSIWIHPLIEDVTSWTMAYDRRHQNVYCFPADVSACYVLHKSMLARIQHGTLVDTQKQVWSPWSKWTTTHAMGFQPSCVMPLVNPETGLDSVYVGDDSGNIYLLEGDGAGDGGTANITTVRTSKIFRLPVGDAFDLQGWVIYKAEFETTLTLTFEYQGVGVFDQAITVVLPATTSSSAVWNGSFYWNGNGYWSSSFNGRLRRRNFTAAGFADMCQVKCSVTGTNDFHIDEIGLQFRAAA